MEFKVTMFMLRVVNSTTTFRRLFSICSQLPLHRTNRQFRQLTITNHMINATINTMNSILRVLNGSGPTNGILRQGLQRMINATLRASIRIQVTTTSMHLQSRMIRALTRFTKRINIRLTISNRCTSHTQDTTRVNSCSVRRSFMTIKRTQCTMKFLTNTSIQLIISVGSIMSIISSTLTRDVHGALSNHSVTFHRIIITM